MSSTDQNTCGYEIGQKVALVFPCSGASNVGQITNELGLRMTREGVAKMSCLAGVGAHISGFTVSARDCDQLVVLDGCPQKCASKVFEHVGVRPHLCLTLTDHGFEKRPGAPVLPEEVERARALVVARMKDAPCSKAL